MTIPGAAVRTVPACLTILNTRAMGVSNALIGGAIAVEAATTSGSAYVSNAADPRAARSYRRAGLTARRAADARSTIARTAICIQAASVSISRTAACGGVLAVPGAAVTPTLTGCIERATAVAQLAW
jgi:hypothetical protein